MNNRRKEYINYKGSTKQGIISSLGLEKSAKKTSHGRQYMGRALKRLISF